MAQIIHIGYPKTGTTWLQHEVFPYFFNYYKIIKDPVLTNIIRENNKITNNELISLYKNILHIPNLIISDEDLVTNKPEHVSPFIKAERLKLLFPRAIIIITIRNQLDIIASAYDQYIKGGGNLAFKEYISQLIKSKKIDHWNYYFIIKKYVSLFGNNNINVLNFDELIKNKDYLNHFLKRYHIILTKKPNYEKIYNRGLSQLFRNIWRFLNLFNKHQIYSSFPTKHYLVHIPGLFSFIRVAFPYINNISCLFSQPSRNYIYNIETREALKKLFIGSNTKLKKEFNLIDLNKDNFLIE